MNRSPLQVGEKFGRLTVLGFSHRNKSGHRCSRFRCECGNEKVILEKHVKAGLITSCRCVHSSQLAARNHANARHGQSGSPEYRAFVEARRRCNNPTRRGAEHYQGRGIKFLFQSFEEWFRELGSKPTPQHSVDRIDTNGHYEAGNVRWATLSEQNLNRRGYGPSRMAA
jgi:hypothetical protein